MVMIYPDWGTFHFTCLFTMHLHLAGTLPNLKYKFPTILFGLVQHITLSNCSCRLIFPGLCKCSLIPLTLIQATFLFSSVILLFCSILFFPPLAPSLPPPHTYELQHSWLHFSVFKLPLTQIWPFNDCWDVCT